MAVKMKPDFMIQKRVAQDNKFSAAANYSHQLNCVSQTTQWFESKTKYEFTDSEKRSQAFIRQEMECANTELKIRRRTRLKLLYQNEARAYEDELADLGLAVQRLHM
eukprot:TRINITY_DN3957_c0_g1_i1.p1 TRINITY_DN3957_c0_g1~~TRINITY_DN3957_c0_g1_i1.p1  ORF type:complete len:107 (-),score=17.81 TRINITY_DN3957_c0_g1_i1:177-497(-)